MDVNILSNLIDKFCVYPKKKGKRKAQVLDNEFNFVDTKEKSNLLNHIKQIVRESPEQSKFACEISFHKLKSNDSKVRLQTLLLIECLFKRSHIYRVSFCNRFKEFISLCISLNNKQLPKPLDTGKILEQKALELIELWYDKYDCQYPSLSSGYYYLKNSCCKVFPSTNQENIKCTIKKEEERENLIAITKYNTMAPKIDQFISDIRAHLFEMNNCIELIIPQFQETESLFSKSFNKDDNIQEKQVDENTAEEQIDDNVEWEDVLLPKEEMDINHIVTEYGLGSSSYNIEVQVDSTQQMIERPTNEALYDHLVDGLALIVKKYKPLIDELLDILNSSISIVKEKEEHKRLLVLVCLAKEDMEQVQEKCGDLLGDIARKFEKRSYAFLSIKEYKTPLNLQKLRKKRRCAIR